MWEWAPSSCCQENVFMRDVYMSVSPCSCHWTQWVGVASSMTENKYSSTQTADISYQGDESLSCLPVCLSSCWRGQRGEPLRQFHMSCFVFLPWWLGDWWRAAERSGVCVLCLSAGTLGRVTTSRVPPSGLVFPGNLPARCGSSLLATPNSTTSTWWSTLT